MNVFAFPDSYKALVIHGWDGFIHMDLRSPKQQIIRSTGINNMASSGCSHWPDGKIEVDLADN